MSHSRQAVLGSVVSLWRYPVKSMMGEELNASEVTDHGLLGDRVYALLDSSEGKVASAKNPRKWPQLFDFRAAFVDTPRSGAQLPPVRITLPDGNMLSSTQTDVNRILSGVLNREVTLEATERGQREVVESTVPNSWIPKAEEYWPDMEGLDYRDTVTDFDLPEGTFFDCAVVHVLTTATLDRLRELYPRGRFEVRRFRPNVVLQTADGVKDYVENTWIGHTLAIGDHVRLSISGPCPRCVMTTLAQGDLPKDPGILRTAAQHNQVNVGVYASVRQGGTIRRGDAVRLE
jgi:MOSC domain-containing protein